MHRKGLLLGGLAVVALVVAGCGSASVQPTSGTGREATANTKTRVVAREWAFELSRTSIPAGKVTFELVNKGKITHEMVVVKTNLPAKGLSARADDRTKMDENAAGQSLGEIENVGPGKTKTGTPDLTSGRYLLICNEAGHYKAGMVTEFRETSGPGIPIASAP